MSYTYLGATARTHALDATWESVDLSTTSLSVILDSYAGIYFEMTHFAYPASVYLNLKQYQDQLTAPELTMLPQAWLTSIGNRTLPVVQDLPNPRELWVKYEDVFAAGYDVDLIALGRHLESQLPAGDKNDLFLRKPSVNFNQLWRYLLVSVNGFFHRSVLGPDGLYVIDGGRTNRMAKKGVAGVCSFREISKLDQIPITDNMITSINGSPLVDGCILNLPQSLQGKTPLLVIGGYLQILDDTYQITGERSLKLHPKRLGIVDRYYDSVESINLESLPVIKSAWSPKQVLVESFFSDATIRAYFTLPQSFVILLDTDEVYLRKHRIENTKLPGVYQYPGPATRMPMFGTHGRILDYISYLEDEYVVLNALNVNEPHRLYRTTEWKTELSITDQCYPSNPWHLADGYLVEFGRYV